MSSFDKKIHKKAWPPWSLESEERGDYRDMQQGSANQYDMLSPVKYIHDNEVPEHGPSELAEGTLEVFDDLLQGEEISLKSMLKSLSSSDFGRPSIALIGVPVGDISSNLKVDANIYSASYSDNISKAASGSQYVSGSPMFCRFPNKIDFFVINATKKNMEETLVTIRNIKPQLTMGAFGAVLSSGDSLSKDILRSEGFTALSKKAGENNVFYLRSNESDKIALAKVYRKGQDVASFLCDTADTPERKADGLQVYSSLRTHCGLLFPYKRATDVMFHMGSVSYPIDIIFASENGEIKKIAKNIQPGSLEVFSCSNVKNVLEVTGGTCNLLNIQTGDNLFVSPSNECSEEIRRFSGFSYAFGLNRVAYKHSKNHSPSLYKVAGKNIVSTRGGALPAGSNCHDFSLINKECVAVLDVDSVYEEIGKIRLYSYEYPDYEKRIHQGLLGESMSISKESYIDIPSDIFFKESSKNSLKEYSFIRGLSDNHSSAEVKKVALKISDPKYTRIVYASRGSISKDKMDAFIESVQASAHSVSNRSEIMYLPSTFGTQDVFEASLDRYGEADLVTAKIIKHSGIPVPDASKDAAKKALKNISDSVDLCKKLSDNIEKNLEAYDSVKDNQDIISGSLGKYNQSCKRNSRIVKRMLLNVKSSIELLNSIRDVSSTSEIIGSLATSAKVCSDEVKSILDLTSHVESGPFYERLSEYTPKAVSSLEDMSLALTRCKDYINSDILGILILTE
tara:strand:+ start:712 stop:2922 length:2211 start_codon:yes stop_codon:yes gene_type:complete